MTPFVQKSPAFRQWFFGSKVTTRGGKPLVVYHGTAAVFDVFDTLIGDLGAHFGTQEQANNIVKNRLGGVEACQPHVMPVYLRICNPLRLKDIGSFHADGIALQLEKKGLLAKGAGKRIEKEIDRDWKLRKKYDPLLRQIIIDAGYDGVVYANTASGEGSGLSYIAFHPEQIKSAIGNIGAFDPKNPSILDRTSALAPIMKKIHSVTGGGPAP